MSIEYHFFFGEKKAEAVRDVDPYVFDITPILWAWYGPEMPGVENDLHGQPFERLPNYTVRKIASMLRSRLDWADGKDGFQVPSMRHRLLDDFWSRERLEEVLRQFEVYSALGADLVYMG